MQQGETAVDLPADGSGAEKDSPHDAAVAGGLYTRLLPQPTHEPPPKAMLSASGLQGSRCSHPQVCEVCGCISPGQHGRGKTGRLFYCTQCWNQCNVHSVPKARPSKQPPQRSCRRHFEVRNALTGEVIDVHPCCTRIYENTIVE